MKITLHKQTKNLMRFGRVGGTDLATLKKAFEQLARLGMRKNKPNIFNELK